MVYITSDLFTPDPRSDRSMSPSVTHTHPWNAMVESQLATGLGKRKRRIEDGDEGPSVQYGQPPSIPSYSDANMVGSSNYSSHQRSSPASKGLLKLHGHDAAFDANNSRLYPLSVTASTYINPDRRPVKQMRRLNPKAALVKSTSHLMDIELNPTPSCSKSNNADAHADSDLRPCHACKTAPKRKRDLENYMECRRCDGRTCYICARECLGCQKAICKKCIVEVGEEGGPWCLECYSRHINS